MKFKEFFKKYILWCLIIELPILAVMIGLDLLSKNLVQNAANASGSPYNYTVSILGSFLQIHYAENTGAAWSIFAGKPWAQTFFLVLSGIVIPCFMVYLFFNRKKGLLIRISLTLIIAGALGNFIDRVFLGYVRDFISFNFGSYSFPIFNVADSALTIGVILFILHALLDMMKEGMRGKKDKQEEDLKLKNENLKMSDSESETNDK